MEKIIATGGKIFQQCPTCGKWVRIDKWLGSMHLCL